jgi:hypothetical protein
MADTAVALEIGAYFATKSLGTWGTNIFGAAFPAEPDSCICITESSGPAPAETLSTNLPALEYANIQVQARDVSYVKASTLCAKAYQALMELRSFTTPEGAVYIRGAPLQRPFFLKQDEHIPVPRSIHVVNATVWRRPVLVT